MQLKDIMSRDLVVIPFSATIQEAAKLMDKLNIGILPVTEEDRLVGTITDRDITIRVVAEGNDPTATLVGEAMTPGIVYCYEDDDVSEAARIMEEQQVRRLIVANDADQPVGLISIGDLATIGQDFRLAGEVLSEVSKGLH